MPELFLRKLDLCFLVHLLLLCQGDQDFGLFSYIGYVTVPRATLLCRPSEHHQGPFSICQPPALICSQYEFNPPPSKPGPLVNLVNAHITS